MKLMIKFLLLSLPYVIGMKMPDSKSEIGDQPYVANITDDQDKDMYVIHAMVYQVGIITNKTDNDFNNTGNPGNQETITFYHTNGSDIDLSNIPAPLLTNVTAQRMVGVAPVPLQTAPGSPPENPRLPWSFENLASLQQPLPNSTEIESEARQQRKATFDHKKESIIKSDFNQPLHNPERLYKRSSDTKTPVKIVSGVAEIPQDVGVNSIAIPPLLSFNNNFSEIPVPIPNTSIVHYAKVNTLVRTP